MIAALALAAAMMGQAAGAPQTPAPTKAVGGDCSSTKPDPASNAIVVCVEKPQGYRIDPDVLAARKAKRQALAGRPKPPETLKDRSCAVVGPAGCQFDAPGVNLLAAAGTAAEMADRLSKGQEVGSMFVTDPQTSEYQYYQLARKEREAKEAAARIKARAAANAAKASR
jgi:hypothetical protein